MHTRTSAPPYVHEDLCLLLYLHYVRNILFIPQAGITGRDVDVAEVHNCFSANELFMYEALGFAKKGDGGKMVETGTFTKKCA